MQGANSALHAAGALDIVPAHYSSLPALIARGRIGADVVLVQLAGPDQDGRYSLGAARDYLVAALERARTVIAEISPAVPWTFGGPYLTDADLAAVVPARYGPAEPPASTPPAVQDAIAANVASLVEDGATLQFRRRVAHRSRAVPAGRPPRPRRAFRSDYGWCDRPHARGSG